MNRFAYSRIFDLYIHSTGDPLGKKGIVRKNLRLTQAKIDRARSILGTETETETVEQALDLVAFRAEVMEGLDRIAGSGLIRDVIASYEPDAAKSNE